MWSKETTIYLCPGQWGTVLILLGWWGGLNLIFHLVKKKKKAVFLMLARRLIVYPTLYLIILMELLMCTTTLISPWYRDRPSVLCICQSPPLWTMAQIKVVLFLFNYYLYCITFHCSIIWTSTFSTTLHKIILLQKALSKTISQNTHNLWYWHVTNSSIQRGKHFRSYYETNS